MATRFNIDGTSTTSANQIPARIIALVDDGRQAAATATATATKKRIGRDSTHPERQTHWCARRRHVDTRDAKGDREERDNRSEKHREARRDFAEQKCPE